MRLTFDYEYNDYSDTANFQPALRNMQQLAENLPEDISNQPTDKLLDIMEKLIELMRYYTVIEDMRSLEDVMRKFQPLLNVCKERRENSAGFYYIEFEFERINALLYSSVSQFAQADQQFAIALQAAQNCLNACKNDGSLSTQQKAFLGFSMIEIYMEASNSADRMMDSGRAYRILASGKETADWVRAYIEDYPGVQDKLSVFYSDLGGQSYAQGDFTDGKECFESAKNLLHGLHMMSGNFYGARKCWVVATQASSELVMRGNPNLINLAEVEINNFLSQSDLDARDISIAQFALGTVLTAKSSILQGAERYQEAVAVSEQGINVFKKAYPVFHEIYDEAEMTMRVVYTPIILRGYSSYVGALEVMGIQLFACGQYDQAIKTFQTALNIMAEETDLKMGESMSNMLQAEMMYYMALIESERDAGKCEYFSTQSADMALETLRGGSILSLATMAVNCCALTAEANLMLKNKPKALQYAEKGLQVLSQYGSSIDGAKDLTAMLEKARKKASRRFF